MIRHAEAEWKGSLKEGSGQVKTETGALSSAAGHVPNSVRTTAAVHLDKVEGGFAITKIELDTTGNVPGLDAAAFEKFAGDAKKNCPVSKALAATEIHLRARLG